VFDAFLAASADFQTHGEDPVRLVRRYAAPEDQEVAGLVAALLSYGKVRSILASVRSVLDPLGPFPRDALLAGEHLRPRWASGFRHRWTSRRDLLDLLEAIARTVRLDGGLGEALASRIRESGSFDGGVDLWLRDLRERATSRRARGRRGTRGPGTTKPGAAEQAPGRLILGRGLRFLIPDPSKGGACKRVHLYLRWMIRARDGIDLGTWPHLRHHTPDLTLPLDAHWIRIGPRLGFTARRTPDGRMAREITGALRRLDPRDPLRYDFPVCHLGIAGGCPVKLEPAHCRACALRGACRQGRRTTSSR
jgi:uncharacterized protein (TIGR02757 family)